MPMKIRHKLIQSVEHWRGRLRRLRQRARAAASRWDGSRQREAADVARLVAAFDAMEKRVRRRERELEARQAQLEDVLRALPEGVCVLWGASGPSLTMNRAAEELLDFLVAGEGERSEPVGGTAPSALPASPVGSLKGLAMIQALLAGQEARQVEVVVPHRSGRKVPVQVNMTPTRDRDGRITGSVAVLRDMSAVRENEARLRTAFEQERSVAEALQQSFVPHVMPELPEFDFGHDYRPARQQEGVGGDFYDAVALDARQLAFAIGDVSGKGVEAALYTAMAKNMWRGFLAEDARPGPLMERLNDALARYLDPDYFVTMVCGVVDRHTGELQYAVAGHPAPLLRRAGGACEALPGRGMILGAMPGVRYETEETHLGAGDLLLLYTDGMNELRRDGEMLEVEGLQQWLQECAAQEPDAVVRAQYEQAREWSGDRLHDDIALLALRCRLLADTNAVEGMGDARREAAA
jgi:PAS domain S-box-containing protein